jgi:hypothetical protein
MRRHIPDAAKARVKCDGMCAQGAEIQVGVTTFARRSHTEIARQNAFDHGADFDSARRT